MLAEKEHDGLGVTDVVVLDIIEERTSLVVRRRRGYWPLYE